MEETKTTPKLVLDDFSEIEELAAPNLTLTPEGELSVEPPKPLDLESSLTDEEKKVVSDFAKQIDLNNSTQMLQYGSAAQKKMLGFSESALANVRTKDMDAVGGMISSLVSELRGFNVEEETKGMFGLFKKNVNKVNQVRVRYDSVAKNVDRIVDSLEGHKIVLLKDVAMLDKMYEMNLAYYKELTMYILAGRQKLSDMLNTELPALQTHAKTTGKPEDAQAANDLAERCNRFDKKLHDLELTRNICIQMGPQIRLVQANDSVMIEKIQSSISNTIPLWKNQMVLSLGLAHSERAIQAQRQVTDITNELLRKNADILKTSTVEAARESERGIVDIETLKHTNQSLIETLDEVLRIQQEGRDKRRTAEGELQRIEEELKSKLLEIRDINR
ncbi:toxic anion resistance protein [Ruminococcaceae bacterium OttesenSCG-928-L11]|nr:toxic anion resistance protein [Ruminococcaceae bacterium OttesenSCG-928-L11]